MNNYGNDDEFHEFTHVWEKDAAAAAPAEGHAHQHHVYDPNDLFYSPVLSLNVNVDGTPLMSPPDPAEVPPEFAMPPPFQPSPAMLPSHPASAPSSGPPSTSPSFGPSAVTSSRPQRRNGSSSSGKVVKQSPHVRTPRWTASYNSAGTPEDLDEIPGPAMHEYQQQQLHIAPSGSNSRSGSVGSSGAVTPAMIMNMEHYHTAPDSADLEERLDSAIIATTATNTKPSPSHHRKSSVTSGTASPRSTSSTPHIRPRFPRSGSVDIHSSQASESPSPANSAHAGGSIAGSANDDETAAMMAANSNYQQIMSGNHHHLGFALPERLTTEVRSRKNSHKVAEQERRNRINTALIDLGKLVTPEAPLNSKAATVEAAIAYIEALQQRVAELEMRLKGRKT